MLTIDWQNLKLSDEWKDYIADWTEQDKELATIGIVLYRHLDSRMPKSDDPRVINPFVKVPHMAQGIVEAIWYGSEELKKHIRDVIITALLMDTLGKIPM